MVIFHLKECLLVLAFKSCSVEGLACAHDHCCGFEEAEQRSQDGKKNTRLGRTEGIGGIIIKRKYGRNGMTGVMEWAFANAV